MPRTRPARPALPALALLAACSAAPSPSATPSPTTAITAVPTAQAVTLQTATGPVAGTLLVPGGRGPFPLALLVSGSGPTDRDGNSVLPTGTLRNDALRLLADSLAARGIATVRWDKRGIAESRPAGTSEDRMRFDHFVDDADAWARQLAADRRFGRIGVVGHSEGALVGTVAALRAGSPIRAVVTLAGAGRKAGDVLVGQLAAQLPPAQLDAVRGVIRDLEAGRTVATLPAALPLPVAQMLFRPSVQPYLVSWMQYDPAAELGKVAASGAPVLVVQGTTDLQVSLDDARRLAAAANVQPVVIEGMNHVLRAVSADRAANVATYTDPARPLAPGVVDAIAGFLGRALR